MSAFFEQLASRRRLQTEPALTNVLSEQVTAAGPEQDAKFALVLPTPLRLLDIADLALELVARHLAKYGASSLRSLSAVNKQCHGIVLPTLILELEVERRHLCSRHEPWHISNCPLAPETPEVERFLWSKSCRQWCTSISSGARRVRRKQCSECNFGFLSTSVASEGSDLFVATKQTKNAPGAEVPEICCNSHCQHRRTPTDGKEEASANADSTPCTGVKHATDPDEKAIQKDNQACLEEVASDFGC